ncbi:MAG: D-alanyl-D-alanine carboxypeptidase [Oscillospiraceae bacterium]|nr:D-alanyl-D-alanine carboxypeptidase [Oscillospiraceae bacterium]
MKKLLTAVLCVLLCAAMSFSSFAATYTPPFDITAKSALLINLDSGKVIYEKNADEKIEPSLLAQMMTAILAIEEIDDPENTLLSMPAYIQDYVYTKNIAFDGIYLAGLYKNEEISAKNLMHAVLIRDANEAAMILADHVADGSMNYFAELMNERAKELGAKNTNFTHPTGLADTESYTTARDIAAIAKHAMTIPEYMEMVNTSFYDGGPTDRQATLYWNTNNRLITTTSEYYNPSVEAIKYGWHDNLGSYSVSLSKRDGYTYLCVVMGAMGSGDIKPYHSAFEETNRLYNWAYDTFRVKVLLEEGKSFGEVPLRLAEGQKDFLRVKADKSFTALIPADIEVSSIQYDVRLPDSVNAPIEEGELIGEVHLILADEEMGVVGLVSSETVNVSRLMMTFDKIADMFDTLWFKFIVVFIFMLITLYAALTIIRNRNRRRYARRRRRR